MAKEPQNPKLRLPSTLIEMLDKQSYPYARTKAIFKSQDIHGLHTHTYTLFLNNKVNSN